MYTRSKSDQHTIEWLRDQLKNRDDRIKLLEAENAKLNRQLGEARVIGLKDIPTKKMVKFDSRTKNMALNLQPDNVGGVIFGTNKLTYERDFVKRTSVIAEIDQRIPQLYYGIKWLTPKIVKEKQIKKEDLGNLIYHSNLYAICNYDVLLAAETFEEQKRSIVIFGQTSELTANQRLSTHQTSKKWLENNEYGMVVVKRWDDSEFLGKSLNGRIASTAGEYVLESIKESFCQGVKFELAGRRIEDVDAIAKELSDDQKFRDSIIDSLRKSLSNPTFVDSDEKSYSCPFVECDHNAALKDNLFKHMASVHKIGIKKPRNKEATNCRICSMSFQNNAKYRAHAKTQAHKDKAAANKAEKERLKQVKKEKLNLFRASVVNTEQEGDKFLIEANKVSEDEDTELK